MKPIERPGRGRELLNHEDRVQVLERRIPSDYPLLYSISLGDLTSISAAGATALGWASGDPCAGPAIDCEQTFVTDGDYLFLPTGYNDMFEVYMNVSSSSGAFDNYLEPVTPGDLTPSDTMRIGFVAYIATDNVVDTGNFDTGQSFVSSGQEPPLRIHGGYDRVWWQHRMMGVVASLDVERDRWALWPYVFLYAGGPTVDVTGLVFTVKLNPIGSTRGGAEWAG